MDKKCKFKILKEFFILNKTLDIKYKEEENTTHLFVLRCNFNCFKKPNWHNGLNKIQILKI